MLAISLVQMNVQKGNPEANWCTVQEQVAEAARRGAEIVVLPELWDSGVAYDRLPGLGSPLDGGLFAQTAALARQHNLYIFGSMLEKHDQGYSNTLPVIGPEGILGTYRKIHLFPPMGEHLCLKPGESPLSLDLPWGSTGFAICYDLRFPELFRRYVGAKIMFLPAEWPHPRLEHFRTLLRARAIENQCYMVAVNRVGTDEDTNTRYFGHSSIIDPWGETVLEAGETEGHFTVTIDLDLVEKVRNTLPVLDSRRL